MAYSREIYTAHDLSRGFDADGRIFFLSRYKLYRQPTGIHRFPDGGRSRAVFEDLAVCRLGPDRRLERYHELRTGGRRVMPGSTVFRQSGTEAVMGVRDNRGETIETVRLGQAGTGGELAELDRGRMRELTQGFPLSEWGLPSPLQFCSKSRRRYSRDVVRKAGDLAYRRAIIEETELSRGEVRRLLDRIEKRKRRLRSYAAAAYALYIRPTEDLLRERLVRPPAHG